jgi:hypothetical protein
MGTTHTIRKIRERKLYGKSGTGSKERISGSIPL